MTLLEYEFSVLKPKTDHIRMDATESNSTAFEVIANVNPCEIKTAFASSAIMPHLSKSDVGATAILAAFSNP